MINKSKMENEQNKLQRGFEDMNKEFFNLKLSFTENTNEIKKLNEKTDLLENRIGLYKEDIERQLKEKLEIVIKELESLKLHLEGIENKSFNLA